MLRKRLNKKTGRTQYALVSRKTPGKVLQWFRGKPSKEAVQKVEARINWFKHRG